jgi:hypothetical protein
MIGGVTGEATNLRWCTQIARNLSEARESRSTLLRFMVHDPPVAPSGANADLCVTMMANRVRRVERIQK